MDVVTEPATTIPAVDWRTRSGTAALSSGVSVTSAATAPNESWKPTSNSADGRCASSKTAAMPKALSVSRWRSVVRPTISTVTITNARTTDTDAPATTT